MLRYIQSIYMSVKVSSGLPGACLQEPDFKVGSIASTGDLHLRPP